MNAAHTPGPWVVKFQPGKLGMVYVDAQTGFVAPPGAVNVADARLIAAAPELLEACLTFAEWLRREDAGFVSAGNSRDTPEGEAAWREWFYGNLDLCSLAQMQVRDAIAKAIGEPE